jgi:hypothetical protein
MKAILIAVIALAFAAFAYAACDAAGTTTCSDNYSTCATGKTDIVSNFTRKSSESQYYRILRLTISISYLEKNL